MPAWSAGIMWALSVAGLVSIARREARLARQAPARVELPEAAQAELDALPATLGAGLAEARDAVVASFTAVERAAAELGDEALVDARALRADALGTLVAALRQSRRLHDAGDDVGLAEVRARGQERLDRLAGALAETRARLLTFLQMRDEGETPDLAAHASQLRHAAVGLRSSTSWRGDDMTVSPDPAPHITPHDRPDRQAGSASGSLEWRSGGIGGRVWRSRESAYFDGVCSWQSAGN
ncbi:MAG: hypothetical protein R3F65_08350 [bacterium]